MGIKFKPSDKHTIGIELEMQLVDPVTFALKDASSEILALSEEDARLKGFLKHELMVSTIEVITDKCDDIAMAEVDLRSKLKGLLEIAESTGTLIVGSGSHPFSLARDQAITKDPRYNRLVNNLQFVARRFNINGLHVHVGIDDGDKCIYVMNRMLYWLPHILALSANSPFWEGEDTGLKSYRTKVFETLPIAGMPFYFRDWNDYAKLVGNYLKTKTIESIRELWWDVRAHPDFGTMEVRICDNPSTLKEALSIAALIQAMTKRFSDDFDKGLPFLRPHSSVIRENKWRACRYGFEGDFINKGSATTQAAPKMIRGLAKAMEAEATELGSLKYLKGINDILDYGGGAARQRRFFEETGELTGVVSAMAKLLTEEIAQKEAG
jgi:carboxylate-amine ligase